MEIKSALTKLSGIPEDQQSIQLPTEKEQLPSEQEDIPTSSSNIILVGLTCLAIGIAFGYIVRDKLTSTMSYDECMYHLLSDSNNPGRVHQYAQKICPRSKNTYPY